MTILDTPRHHGEQQETTNDTAPAPPPVASPPSRRDQRTDSWVVIAVSIALVCLLISLIAVGFAARMADENTATTTASSAPVELDVALGDLFVRPAEVSVPEGAELILHVTNEGALPHDLKVDGTSGTRMLSPGESETVTVGPFRSSTEAWCTVPGHREAGMVMAINVEGATASGGQQRDSAAPAAAIDFAAEPAADWVPFDPALKPAPAGTEHNITLSASETVLEVSPGVFQEMWTFGGTVPGPILRGKVGDLFTVTLRNDGQVAHSIDFHASKVAWNDEMRSIEPGESLVYQFEAKHAGIYMYHCGTPPALHHIGNGMFGALIVDPPGLPPVDHEYVFVQSELYIGADRAPGDLTKMQRDEWDAVVFNGYVNQYLHRPIQVEPGQRIRTWVLDAGPSENSSFHIVGTIFDRMYKEGAYTLRGDGQGGAQTLDLQPAQGGFVEFTFDEPGLYPIVTHKFSNVGKGALGLFKAGDGGPAATGGH